LAVLFLAAPIYFLQYTFWGLVLHGPCLRILLAVFSALLVSWLLTKDLNQGINLQGLLIALVLISGAYIIFVSLQEVTTYPFSLGWSEGNRLWDYSIMFGRSLYQYPSDKPIFVLLDIGRRFIGGIPFLIPGIQIWQVRLWLALIDIVPYLILGWAAFRLDGDHRWPWLLAGIWAFTFVHQGPIHPPLLIAAILVALAWKRPLWLAIPLIVVAGYFAEISRLTWMFAPGLWAGMLEFGGTSFQGRQLDKRTWLRTISSGLAGLFGGFAIPYLLPGFLQWIRSLSVASAPATAPGVSGPVSAAGNTLSSRVSATIYTQPLIWSRLLPNATYGTGILIGLALAILPLIVILVYLLKTGRWKPDLLQKLAIVLPLLAFLVVGLIALIVVPGYNSLQGMTPLSIHNDIKTVAVLADISGDPLPNPLPDTLPSEEDTTRALNRIQREVANASQKGDVLFMDQRQLLTFGYIKDILLIPEYDKKVLINHALSGNAQFFAGFYRDLASQRFSLIVTSPVNRRFDKSEGHFAEENNAWVEWVTTPLLCYYESFDRLKRVDVELLVPRKDISTCEQVLPIQLP
jgi:hypothetical protein